MWTFIVFSKQITDVFTELMKCFMVRNETDARLVIPKYKKNTMKRKKKRGGSEKIKCFSLRVLVSNKTIR